MPVVLELKAIECSDSAVGRVAGNHMDLVGSQRRVSQIERHLAWCAGELQAVSARESGKTVFPDHKIVPESGVPLTRITCRFRNRFQIKPVRVFAANQNSKRVVETKRRAHFHFELLRIFTFDLIIDSLWVRDRLMMKNIRERRAGIFGIEIDLARDERAMTH